MNKYELVVIAKGSDVGHKAAEEAAIIARDKNIDTIHLLFVNDIDFYSGGGILHLKEELQKSLENIGDAIIRMLTETIKKHNSNVNVKKIELSGKTAEEILKFVNENDINILIIPKDKRGPIEKSLVGGEIEPFFDQIRKRTNLIVVQ
ncbi:universal stress protein [Hippea alviniae]|uniref:universal stress protein n=1 Tax=Hippea alviniae TaxID=1279027 RepID=UPI0003B36FAA|nr:universal stress protein [Hippea alviniae]